MSAPRLLDSQLLSVLYDRWVQRDLPILTYLRPGLSDDEMDELTEPLGITLPEEARVWWRWHDGADEDPDNKFHRDFGPMRHYIPLARCVQICAEERALLAFDPDNPATWYWVRGWFPFTSVSPLTLLDTGVERDQPVPVRAYHREDDDAYLPGLASIGTLIEHYIEAMDRGLWLPPDEHQLRYDLDKWTPEDEQLGLL